MHKDTDLLTVVTEFTFTDTPVSGTAAKECEVNYDYRPMVCAFDCKELAGFTATGLSEYLADAEVRTPARSASIPSNSLLTGPLQTELQLTAHGVIAS